MAEYIILHKSYGKAILFYFLLIKFINYKNLYLKNEKWIINSNEWKTLLKKTYFIEYLNLWFLWSSNIVFFYINGITLLSMSKKSFN